MRLLIVPLLLALLSTPLAAQSFTQPSFDCTQASTANETAICDSDMLAWLDRQMALLYRDVRALEGDAALEAQRAFHRSLRTCEGDHDCLERGMTARIEALSAALGETRSGRFGWATQNGDAGGAVWIADHLGAEFAIMILTHNASHTCQLETDLVQLRGGQTLLVPTEDGEPPCNLEIRFGPDEVSIDGPPCSWYCGMRATLNGSYTRSE